MKIDWFTVIAQLLNFMILVMLLKRYLYKPVLKAIQERENLISDQLAEAGKIKTESGRIREEYFSKKEALEKNQAAFLEKAEKEAEEQRQRMLEVAKSEAEILRASLHKNLMEEQKNLQKEISGSIQQEVFSVTRKVISDLSGAQLENLIIRTFHNRLVGLPEEERMKFIDLTGSPGSRVVVTTSFPLSTELKEETIQRIKLFSTAPEIKFSVSPVMIAGIMLECNGFSLSWNIQDYIEGIEKRIAELTAGEQQQDIIAPE
jgi:F-type H+-transporting ATPase subunit b